MQKTKAMTTGVIWKRILIFTLPLLAGNLFQLLYNTMDSVVVGQYVGKEALAAVSASNPLINLTIGFFMGLSVGAGVIVSRRFGAGNHQGVSIATHTFLMLSIIAGILITILGYFGSQWILELLQTPSDILEQSKGYLQVYFLGAVFITVYNAGTGILRALGDSKNPLYFLIIASAINIFLDLLFVVQFNMGVLGVAWATLIAQAVSATLVLGILFKTKESCQLRLSKLKIHPETMKEIIRIGIPSGFQNMIVSFSNVLVQGYVNGFGSAAVAGFGSALRLDSYITLPINSFALSVTTYTSQNLGANQIDRAKKGIAITLKMSLLSVLFIGLPVWIFADYSMAIFSTNAEVIAIGAKAMRTIIPFSFFLALHQVYSGALRAKGITIVPMMVSIFSMVVMRQIYLWFMLQVYQDINIVASAYSVTWTLAGLCTTWFFHKVMWMND